ncbi:MAG: cytochrome c-type biogenesis protein CcmH [Actinomycetota bacterium]|nr:cytochrome c-type biogenesis protein CcmH [Actinomycetota bacterium]
MRRSLRRSWLPYLVMGPVLMVALVVGSGGSGPPPTPAQRADRIAREVRCPTCESQSAADSRAPASDAIREEIRRRVDAGEGDGAIRSFLVSRYGKDILLKPEARGVTGLVWVLPVVALLCALAGLGLAFGRRRARPRSGVTREDEALVAEARGQ